MKKIVMKSLWIVLLGILLVPSLARSQDTKLYDLGSVWEITFVKLFPHSGDTYLSGLQKTWKSSMDEMKKEGMILSYKILSGDASNEDDFNLMLMIEFKNYAAFDPDPVRDARQDAVEKKIKDALGDDYDKLVQSYTTLREITGVKTMREIILK